MRRRGIDSPRPLYITCTISTGQTSLFPVFPLILRGRESLHPLFAACHLISTGRGGLGPPRLLFTAPQFRVRPSSSPRPRRHLDFDGMRRFRFSSSLYRLHIDFDEKRGDQPSSFPLCRLPPDFDRTRGSPLYCQHLDFDEKTGSTLLYSFSTAPDFDRTRRSSLCRLNLDFDGMRRFRSSSSLLYHLHLDFDEKRRSFLYRLPSDSTTRGGSNPSSSPLYRPNNIFNGTNPLIPCTTISKRKRFPRRSLSAPCHSISTRRRARSPRPLFAAPILMRGN